MFYIVISEYSNLEVNVMVSAKQRAQRNRFAKAAKACKGKTKTGFRACIKQKLRKR